MEFLAPIAELLGLTVGQLTTGLIIIGILVVGWYIVRGVVKIAVRTFLSGCLVILLLGIGLYVFFVLL
ncbi:MAG: hypothetical protein GX484_00535 [Chloroflexi bacterium]|nr:hypothetical protein [Chloroflexota bacterium]